MNIEAIIKKLGDFKRYTTDNELRNSVQFINELETQLGISFPEEFKEFHSKFGAISFNQDVKVYSEAFINILSLNGYVDANFYYSLNPKSDFFIGDILSSYSDQLPNNLVPFCDGEQGDLICFSTSKVSMFHIYYWYHEAPDNKCLFHVADSFLEFLESLVIFKDDHIPIDGKTIDHSASPEFLELLKKSGYGSSKN